MNRIETQILIVGGGPSRANVGDRSVPSRCSGDEIVRESTSKHESHHGCRNALLPRRPVLVHLRDGQSSVACCASRCAESSSASSLAFRFFLASVQLLFAIVEST